MSHLVLFSSKDSKEATVPRFFYSSGHRGRNTRQLYIQRRAVKKMVRQAKVAEEHRVALACHDNPKEFFGYVNKHKPRAPLGPVLFVDGHLLTNDEEMAREFNNYFSNVFTVEDVDNIPDPVIHACENIITDIDCAEPEVQAKLKELKPARQLALTASCPKSSRLCRMARSRTSARSLTDL